MIERSLVLMKPDAVQRGIVGEILMRFERAGLKMVGAKLIQVDKAFGERHYCHSDEWKVKVGERNLVDCEEYGEDPMELFGTTDPKKIGALVDSKSAEFISMGPVLALVLEGPNAIKKIRSLVGPSFSSDAAPGTIRGDYGLDSAYSGMIRKRAAFNMVHASGEVDEAKEEIALWFTEGELLDYRRVHEDLYAY